jgi:hypothetical protein
MTFHIRIPFPHPRVPNIGIPPNAKIRCTTTISKRSSRALANELSIAHAPLLPQRRTLLLLNEAVKLALNTLEAVSLTVRELAIENLSHLLPFLAKVNTVVPDEVHFLFLVFGARRPAAVAVCRGAAGDAGEAFPGMVGAW